MDGSDELHGGLIAMNYGRPRYSRSKTHSRRRTENSIFFFTIELFVGMIFAFFVAFSLVCFQAGDFLGGGLFAVCAYLTGKGILFLKW